MWDPDEVDWWVDVFDDLTEELVVDVLLVGLSETEIRNHYAIDPSIEPIDGLEVTKRDLPWLAPYLGGRKLDLGGRSAFISVIARSAG